jgi:hypothetical protein
MFLAEFEQLSEENQAFGAALLLFDRHTLPELADMLPIGNALNIDSLIKHFLELDRSTRIHFLVSRLLELLPHDIKRLSAHLPDNKIADALAKEPEPLREMIVNALSNATPTANSSELDFELRAAVMSSFFAQFADDEAP